MKTVTLPAVRASTATVAVISRAAVSLMPVDSGVLAFGMMAPRPASHGFAPFEIAMADLMSFALWTCRASVAASVALVRVVRVS
jgi:hypothetical protein